MNFLILQNGRVIDRASDANEAQNKAVQLSEQFPNATFETARIIRKIYYEFTPGSKQQQNEVVVP